MAANVNDNDTVRGSAANTSIYLPSPNRIPPRTSSTGYTYTTPSPPARSVLRPVPESDWLAKGIHTHRTTSSASHVIQHQPDTMTSTDFQDPSRYATENFDYAARKTWTEKKEEIVKGPFNYLLSQPGKDIRTKLISAFNVWLDVPQETLDVISKVVAMLHTSSLLVDDVEDNSSLRRGLPVAHKIYGTAQTINSANYVYFCALQELQKLENPRALTIFSEELVNLHRGQGMDLYWRDSLTCPSEDEYLEMVGNKTGGLFRLAIKLMQAESKTVLDCVPLVNILGIIFQIQDDYRNLSSPKYGENKGFCEDLTEGKFSFLIIHSIRANPLNQQLLNILKQKTTDDTVKRYAVNYMESTGSFEYTRKVLAVLAERARKAADALSGDAQKSVGIHDILDKLVI
ncbi:isoprenoid synthase domain-containing protein [Xylaria sp. FL1777]|nr:isoprenoid synthase domain-containing protein [Xylaria sp. FL1777]